jgi:hypothetical protein
MHRSTANGCGSTNHSTSQTITSKTENICRRVQGAHRLFANLKSRHDNSPCPDFGGDLHGRSLKLLLLEEPFDSTSDLFSMRLQSKVTSVQ